MPIKKQVENLFFDKKGHPLYQNYLTFMIDNPDFFHNVLVPFVNNEIVNKTFDVELKYLDILRNEYKNSLNKYINQETPFHNEYNVKIPKVMTLIDCFYSSQLANLKIRIDTFNIKKEESKLIDDFINITTEIYSVGGRCKFQNNKKISLNDIITFVNSNSTDIFNCYVYLCS